MHIYLQRGSDRLWEDELPSKRVNVNSAWREQASRFLRNRVDFLIVFFIGFLMVLDQISANLRMIPSNVENLSKSNNLISNLFLKLPFYKLVNSQSH